MKKILMGFLILMSALSFIIAYHNTTAESIQAMETAGQRNSTPFWIPVSPVFSNPGNSTEIYYLIQRAARETHVNVIRTSLGYTPSQDQELIRFVLLTDSTTMWRSFRLDSGHFLTSAETMSSQFISSRATGSHQQVGQLHLLGSRPIVEIRPLAQLSQYMSLPGEYFIEALTPGRYNGFVKTFVQEVNGTYHATLQHPYGLHLFTGGASVSFTRGAASTFGVFGAGYFQYLQDIWYLVGVITIVLLMYYCFAMAKRLGIMKLHGVGSIKLWYEIIGRMILVVFGATLCLAVIVGLVIAGFSAQFIINLVIEQVEIFAVGLVASLIVLVYGRRIKVGEAIKNRQDTRGIFILNLSIKAVWSIVLILLITGVWQQYQGLSAQRQQLNVWRNIPQTAKYGVFYPVYDGHDLLNVQLGSQNTDYLETNWLYGLLNRRGAIYIDASGYETQALLAQSAVPGYIRSVTVNPNALKVFPVYQVNHQPVTISEHDANWIVLVPVAYTSHKQQILNFFRQQRQHAYQAEENVLNMPVPARVLHQKVQIIWLASNQKFFSFNPNVFPNQNHMIDAPLIQVMTTANSVSVDRANMTNGSGVAENLKVPLAHGNPKETYQAIEQDLTRLQLSHYLTQIVTIPHSIQLQISTLGRQMRVFLGVALALFLSSLFLVLQNLSIIFSRYQKRFLVKRIFGISLIRAYREYWIYFLSSWVGQLLIVAVISKLQGASVSVSIGIGLVILLLELLVSAIALIPVERRNQAKALKRGL